jgi:hypothetical protein
MNAYATTDEKSTEAEDTDDVDERTVRALEEYLTVLPDAVDAPGMVRVVSHTGEEYTVDVRGRNCECPDATYNLDEETDCKHVRRARFALGLDAIPAEALDACDVEPNFGAFVNEDAVRVAAADGGVIEATGDAEVLTEEEDETDECEVCAALSDDLPCFEHFMQERGHSVGGDA